MATCREKVLVSLQGGHTGSVPFTIYENMIPQCRAERDMRNRGMCIVNRHVPVFKTHTPNVTRTQDVYEDNGRQMTRIQYETPVGTLTSLLEAAGSTTWQHERLFKSPDDYKALLFLIKDEMYEPSYDALIAAQKADGGDAMFRSSFGLEPLQSLISSSYMDMQDFCMEWMDNRDEIITLYSAIVENRRKIYPLVAESPVSHANYGGNVVPTIIGLETYENYYIQHYNEAAEIMHKHGKLIGSHYDADCGVLAEAINRTDLDYIEAFTPAPDTDMSLGDARAAWPDKVIWINYPSSVHLNSDEAVKQKAIELLDELDSVDGIIMGITENMPENRWRNSCRAIMDGLDAHARKQPSLYN